MKKMRCCLNLDKEGISDIHPLCESNTWTDLAFLILLSPPLQAKVLCNISFQVKIKHGKTISKSQKYISKYFL